MSTRHRASVGSIRQNPCPWASNQPQRGLDPRIPRLRRTIVRLQEERDEYRNTIELLRQEVRDAWASYLHACHERGVGPSDYVPPAVRR